MRGRVQGVGYRYFVEYTAGSMGVTGWVRNQDDGTVEVYAIGNTNVRGVNIQEDTIDAGVRSFRIR